MSIQHCEECNEYIDTDLNAEHFAECEECGETECGDHDCEFTEGAMDRF